MGAALGGLQALVDAHYEALYALPTDSPDRQPTRKTSRRRRLAGVHSLASAPRTRTGQSVVVPHPPKPLSAQGKDEKRHRIVPLDAVGDLPGREADNRPRSNRKSSNKP